MALNLVEASIIDLKNALDSGTITSVELCTRYLLRISAYDCRETQLNSIPILNPSVLQDAAESDAQRAADKAAGRPIRPLEGIPYTVKDSYQVKGMTAAAGSPALTGFVANEDAFTVQKLREAGAILIGKTNMPPMAYGGMQRGAYGRAESPYNGTYLTAAFASGSSNGSATSTAASFAAFGLGAETVSSGRSPASNNGLVAYTPSRGMLSIRGNWPLYPTCDVVVPHTRTVSDLLALLDVLAVPDPRAACDLWREQSFIPIPSPTAIHPSSGSFLDIANPSVVSSLRGKRIAIPRMYIGHNDEGCHNPVALRPSIAALFDNARRALTSAGAELIETPDFPLITNYEKLAHLPPSAGGTVANVPGLPAGWMAAERGPLLALAWDAFLAENHSSSSSSSSPAAPPLKDFATDVNVATLFPMEKDGPQTRYANPLNAVPWTSLPTQLRSQRSNGVTAPLAYPGLPDALRALEAARQRDLEAWMDTRGFDAVCFPANGDVGRADADRVDESARAAWRNGVYYSNGNRVLRHLGVPTVSVCMGVMDDTGMPCNVTFAGKAYADRELLEVAAAFERVGGGRAPPGRTPALGSDVVVLEPRGELGGNKVRASEGELKAEKKDLKEDGSFVLNISGKVEGEGEGLPPLRVFVDGEDVSERFKMESDGAWQCTVERPAPPTLWHPEYLKEAGVEKVLLEKTLVLAVAGGRGSEDGQVLVVE
ncbi:Amidase [Lasiodiplodia theobromae]|uniref:Glutamyl-tRNA(Gln) amidotransferase subunit A n=1 Tax=Lasiodiplodia theobromae TaxID=45133 RepID=A0A5N5DUH9_9PEZI|nr:Amidase [Lasiodiplodia theobromae]KAB2581360.1 Glutamyl-tRNA(Gln) amidotransferase subunit A [Lasiodiplodia theobromae]KAF4543873.1 Amidase [Lasiodiplodia theobromae]